MDQTCDCSFGRLFLHKLVIAAQNSYIGHSGRWTRDVVSRSEPASSMCPNSLTNPGGEQWKPETCGTGPRFRLFWVGMCNAEFSRPSPLYIQVERRDSIPGMCHGGRSDGHMVPSASDNNKSSNLEMESTACRSRGLGVVSSLGE